MSLISPNFAVKLIIFSQFLPGAFFQNCWKKPCSIILSDRVSTDLIEDGNLSMSTKLPINEPEKQLDKDERRTSPKDELRTSAADELETSVNDESRSATPALKELVFEEKITPAIDECKTSIENSVTTLQGNESGTAVEDEVGASLAVVREINGAQITVKIKSTESVDDYDVSNMVDSHEMLDHKEIDFVDEIDDFADECDSIKSESDQLEDFDDECNESESDQMEDFDDDANSIKSDGDQMEDDSFETVGNMEEPVQGIKQVSVN